MIQEVFYSAHDLVVVLASYSSRRDFLISAQNHNLNSPLLLIPPNAFDWWFEQSNIPYFFVLHPNMRISNIFVPDERYPELTIRYLESIKRLLQ